jgi:heme exporter protein D
MWPDLAPYTGTVLAAYGVSAALLVALLAATFIRSARIRRELAEAEARRRRAS